MEGAVNPAKTYPCQFCDQVFVTAQALGGHQNCHRSEREAMKKAREDQKHLSMLGSPQFKHMFPPTVPAYIRNHQSPLGGLSFFHGPTYVPSRMVPKEFYFQPFANQQHMHPNNNNYFGSGYRSNNPYGTVTASASDLLPRNHEVIPSYYEGMPRHEKPYCKPQSYDFFPNYTGGTSGIVNQLNTNLSIMEGDQKEGNTIVGPSTVVVKRQTGAKTTNNNDEGDETELDLTLHL